MILIKVCFLVKCHNAFLMSSVISCSVWVNVFNRLTMGKVFKCVFQSVIPHTNHYQSYLLDLYLGVEEHMILSRAFIVLLTHLRFTCWEKAAQIPDLHTLSDTQNLRLWRVKINKCYLWAAAFLVMLDSWSQVKGCHEVCCSLPLCFNPLITHSCEVRHISWKHNKIF